MSNGLEVEKLKSQLAGALRKYSIAKYLVIDLERRVGPTSRDLSEARTGRKKAKNEVVRLKKCLKELGLSDSEVAAVPAAEIDVVAAVFG